MQALYRLVARVMNTDLPVLISGESGTGKSLIARAIHDFSDQAHPAFRDRHGQRFARYRRPGTGLARAKGGSVLFDEIGDIDLESQARIVRMMDSPGDHVPRFMATSQSNLGQAMEQGRMRQDLYYRLGGATSRCRRCANAWMTFRCCPNISCSAAKRTVRPSGGCHAMRVELMRAYSWPGNVRQLENAIRRLVLTSRADEITRAEVEAVLGNQPEMEPVLGGGNDTEKLSASVNRHLRRYFDLHGNMLPPPGLYGRILREVEGPLLEIALEATGGNQAKCADLLGINRNTLRKKITDLDIRVTRRRKLM
jgi:two-component system, NtrC family, nitrogen regulation response regulator GlnG